MKDTPQIVEAKIRSGYRSPIENPLVCKNCGAVGFTPTPYRHCYFCKRHHFYVHSHGYCPSFDTGKYIPPNTPKPSPWKQQELF